MRLLEADTIGMPARFYDLYIYCVVPINDIMPVI